MKDIGTGIVESIFKLMSNNAFIRGRNMQMHSLHGSGVWLLYANSTLALMGMDGSKAIYVPLSSLDMFFTDPTLLQERVNPQNEMLLAIACLVPTESTTRHFWTKVSMSVQKDKPTRKENTQLQSIVPIKRETLARKNPSVKKGPY